MSASAGDLPAAPAASPPSLPITPESLLLAAAAAHDLPTLTTLLKTISPKIQHPTTLQTPLHLAVSNLTPATAHAAEATLDLLLLNGAIWNDLDAAGDTPGCIAWRAGEAGKGCYEKLVDAGVRAEVLLGRIASWGLLGSDSEVEEEEEEDDDEMGVEEEAEAEVEVPKQEAEQGGDADFSTTRYLSSDLSYDSGKLIDADTNGVMMRWETGVMKASVDALLPADGKGGKVLNIGFGMGIVDTAFQERLAARGGGEHVIVEPHPDVLKKMEADRWMAKPGVRVLRGRWQDVLMPLIEAGELFDAIYFDTFAEEYDALKTFFSEYVVALLEGENGRFGFFHGLGADRRVSYDVYTRVVEIDLKEVGLETRWEEVPVEIGEEEWGGVRRRYWDVGNIYKLPVCTF